MKFPHLRAAVCKTPWAIMPDRLEAIAEVIERRVEGYRLSPEEIAGIRGDRPRPGEALFVEAREIAELGWPAAQARAEAARGARGGRSGSAIAVINVMGIIAQHAHEVDDISGPGGTSTERVATNLRAALADASVASIVLNINSPGGNVYGVQELATEIREARATKPIVAQVNSLAASAAYWIAAAAGEIVLTPSGEVGSIGVYALHQDVSEKAKMEGFKFTFVSAGKYKVEGHPFEPLQDEARAAIQSSVNEYYDSFVTDVARGRGVAVADVRKGFGEGRTVGAKHAVGMRMVDRIAPMKATLERLAGGPRGPLGGTGQQAALAASDEAYDPARDPRRLRHELRQLQAKHDEHDAELRRKGFL